MTTDILDLPGWTVLAKRLEDHEYELEAEYTVKPTACQKCGVLDRLYRHGTKDTIYRDSPIRGHATRILARVQRYKCRECGETFLQPLAGIQEDRRMTARCAEYIKEQCLRDTFTSIADHVGCDDKTVRNLAGEYIATQEPDVIIHAGDHYDMASLSSYEQRGSKYFEGKRYLADIAAGNEGWERLEEGLQKRSVPSWTPRRDYLLGNHEQRIERAVQADPRLEGVIGYEGFNAEKLGWEMHPFLKVVERGGVAFAHYFYNPNTGRAYAGSVDTMLRNIGFSFAMGHQQGLRYARRELNNGTVQVGLVAGSFYEHNEEYRGHQAQSEWRGLIVMHEVRDGNYDLMQVSLDYLRRKFG